MKLETTGGITLNLDFWDCECKKNYIKSIALQKCNKCEAFQDEMPSSRADEETINRFKENQTLSIIGELRNLGIGLKILKNNKWEQLSVYQLPFKRFVLLYNDNFKLTDLGIY